MKNALKDADPARQAVGKLGHEMSVLDPSRSLRPVGA
jgi:hypothetical protein